MFVENINWSSFTHSTIEGLSLLSERTQREAKFANITIDSVVYELLLISGSITLRSFFRSVNICLTCIVFKELFYRSCLNWTNSMNMLMWVESVPVVQGSDRWVPGSSPLLCGRSTAQAEQLQMHIHRFAKWVSLSVTRGNSQESDLCSWYRDLPDELSLPLTYERN